MDDDGEVSAIHGTLLYTPPEGGPEDGAMGVTGYVYSSFDCTERPASASRRSSSCSAYSSPTLR
jgi:hypothetical protein